jgi:hypothetical protein
VRLFHWDPIAEPQYLVKLDLDQGECGTAGNIPVTGIAYQSPDTG